VAFKTCPSVNAVHMNRAVVFDRTQFNGIERRPLAEVKMYKARAWLAEMVMRLPQKHCRMPAVDMI
jgi:hypothetical protein